MNAVSMPPEKSEQATWFAENLLPHKPALEAWLRSRFGVVSEIDDIVQEAFIRVLGMRENEDIRSPKSLLFTTARNLALDRARSFRVSRTDPLGDFEESDVIDDSEGASDARSRKEELEIMTLAIQSLPARCRQIFTLRKVYGLSQKEIARRLGVAEKTVSAQISIGMRKCASFVARYVKEGDQAQ